MDEIMKQLDTYIRETCEVAEDDPDYSVDVNLFDAGFLDSVGATEAILYVEQTFGVEITQRDITLHPMNTVREIAAVAAEKKGLL